tara:strand:- start:51 stop:1346 length:1296 start_codon:yes stop_codon:yes gene_type:complete
MNRFSRILHHIDIEDIKLKYLDNLATKKIEEEHKNKLNEIFEKKKYQWRESFTNITVGNKVGQTFRHNPSGQTVTTAGALGGVESIPSTVSVFGDNIPGPNASSYALQGYAIPLGNVLKRKKTEDTNKKLDASQEFARKVGADEIMDARVDVDKDLTSKRIKLVSKILGKLGNSRIVKELKTFFDYLNNDLPDKITNEYFSKEHLKSLWSQAFINDKGNFAVNDLIIGSGQKLTYNPITDTYSVKFNYDFSDNVTEMLNNPGKYDNIIGKIRLMSGGRYGLDALGLPGLLVDAQKAKGFGKGVYGEISISRDELFKINNQLPYMDEIMNPEKEVGGFDTGHGYSSPPDWLTSWASKSQFSGDLRSLWDGKTRTWNLGGKIVDNEGNPIKKPASKPKSKSVERIKSMAKTRRQSLSLDEPVVRSSKKKKKKT